MLTVPIRQLGESERAAVERILDRDPYAGAQIAERVAAHGLNWWRSDGRVFGYGSGRRVESIVWSGAKGGDAATAVVDTKPQSYRVWVSGVNSADAYARLVGTLSRNELVRGVQAEQARGDGVELKIDTAGPLQRVLDSLGNGPIRVSNAKPPVEGVDALLDMQP